MMGFEVKSGILRMCLDVISRISYIYSQNNVH